MCMSDSSAQHMIEVSQPVTLEKIKDAAGKKLGHRLWHILFGMVMMSCQVWMNKRGLIVQFEGR